MAPPKVRFSGGLKVSWRSLSGADGAEGEKNERQRGEVATRAMRSNAATVPTIASWCLRGRGVEPLCASMATADLKPEALCFWRRLRSARMSAALWKRSSRSFSTAFWMTRSNSAGMAGFFWMGGGGGGLGVENFIEDAAGGFGSEWQDACGHFVKDDAEGKDVGASVERLAEDLLGRHVGDSADGAAGTGEFAGVERCDGVLRWVARDDFCEAEIENLGGAPRGDENIGGLDVAMPDAFAVSGVEPVGDLDGDGEKGVHVHGAAGDGVFQRGAFEIFHGDEGFAGVFADIVDRADVGMAERGGRFGFAAETLEGLAIAGEIIG